MALPLSADTGGAGPTYFLTKINPPLRLLSSLMPKPVPKKQDKSRLTDEECDFIIQRVLWKLRDATNPIEFFRGMGRGVEFDVSDQNRAKVREMIRLLARGGG